MYVRKCLPNRNYRSNRPSVTIVGKRRFDDNVIYRRIQVRVYMFRLSAFRKKSRSLCSPWRNAIIVSRSRRLVNGTIKKESYRAENVSPREGERRRVSQLSVLTSNRTRVELAPQVRAVTYELFWTFEHRRSVYYLSLVGRTKRKMWNVSNEKLLGEDRNRFGG